MLPSHLLLRSQRSEKVPLISFRRALRVPQGGASSSQHPHRILDPAPQSPQNPSHQQQPPYLPLHHTLKSSVTLIPSQLRSPQAPHHLSILGTNGPKDPNNHPPK